MSILGFLFLGIFLSRLISHVLRSIGVNEIVGYLVVGVLLGLIFNGSNYINELVPLMSLAAIFVVFYTGATSNPGDIAENLSLSIIASLTSVAASTATIMLVMQYLGYPFHAAFIVALTLSDTATEMASILIEKFPQRIKSILVAASSIDDILVVFMVSAYYAWILEGSFYNALTPIAETLTSTIIVYIMLFKRSGSLKRIYSYMSRDISFFMDATLIFLSILILLAVGSGASTLVAAYLAGILVSGGLQLYDPMLRYRTRISDFAGILSSILNAVFIPVFMLGVGLYARITTVDVALLMALVASSFLAKMIPYTILFKVQGESVSTSMLAGVVMSAGGLLELTLLLEGLKLGLISTVVFNTVTLALLLLMVVTTVISSIAARRENMRLKLAFS